MTALGSDEVSPDRVSRLIKLLAEERSHLTSVEIAETLWLAMQMEPVATVVPTEQIVRSETTSEFSADTTVVDLDSNLPQLPPIPKVNIAIPAGNPGVLPPQALPVWLADPALLTDSLAIVRALKPLLQKVAAGTGKRLDEAATVDNIARTRLCLPILEPEQEPWFDIILVVDRGSSMHIWQRLVQDVVRILRRYGAFRDVQVFGLVVHQSGQSTADSNVGDTVQLLSKPQRPGHRPSELIDQRGQRIVMVLSDCAGAYWWDGTLLPMLRAWGNIMPTVVWQMLPAWMWQRTALGRGTAVAISNDIPGVANQRLKTRVQARRAPEDANQRLPVPVVTSEVRDLARWSLMVAGDLRAVIPGFLLPQQGSSVPRLKGMEDLAHDRARETLEADLAPDPNTAFNQALETIARERVQRFLDLASPLAQRLIMLLAAAPVITLPVVRLIRDAMLCEAQSPLPVAEVFLSGLILRLPGQEDRKLERVLQEDRERVQAKLDQQDSTQPEEDALEPAQSNQQDLVQYDFALRVREVLLEKLPAIDTIDVLNSVSAAVERRWNQFSPQDFRAFLTDPNIEVPGELQGLRSFASVAASILEPLGGEYASFAQQLRYGSGEVPPVDSGGENDGFLMEDLEYEVAQFIDFPLLQEHLYQTAWVEVESLQQFDFETATIAQQRQKRPQKQPEWVITKSPGYGWQRVEDLGNGVQLELVEILGGSFRMGSPNDEPERDDNESPQHEVTLSDFFIAKYPITQAQWQEVAALPQINLELAPDPSSFKGENRPVERVSWHKAVEFCARLSVQTGREYGLPTEAEWEYACRAGTSTPFHFGEMITTDLANYGGNTTYNDGPKGVSRGETTPIGSFPANAWGLYDLHGNVWEWCADHWHSDYIDKPDGLKADGTAPWLSDDEDGDRSLRGGSWYSYPRYCRSAVRSYFHPDGRYHFYGFRVVCRGMSSSL